MIVIFIITFSNYLSYSIHLSEGKFENKFCFNSINIILISEIRKISYFCSVLHFNTIIGFLREFSQWNTCRSS